MCVKVGWLFFAHEHAGYWCSPQTGCAQECGETNLALFILPGGFQQYTLLPVSFSVSIIQNTKLHATDLAIADLH